MSSLQFGNQIFLPRPAQEPEEAVRKKEFDEIASPASFFEEMPSDDIIAQLVDNHIVFVKSMIDDLTNLSGGTDGEIIKAINVLYDNTVSGLDAGNVQEAINELSARPSTGGGYEPPVDGIPIADLSQDIQNTLNSVETKLSHVMFEQQPTNAEIDNIDIGTYVLIKEDKTVDLLQLITAMQLRIAALEQQIINLTT